MPSSPSYTLVPLIYDHPICSKEKYKNFLEIGKILNQFLRCFFLIYSLKSPDCQFKFNHSNQGGGGDLRTKWFHSEGKHS